MRLKFVITNHNFIFSQLNFSGMRKQWLHLLKAFQHITATNNTLSTQNLVNLTIKLDHSPLKRDVVLAEVIKVHQLLNILSQLVSSSDFIGILCYRPIQTHNKKKVFKIIYKENKKIACCTFLQLPTDTL